MVIFFRDKSISSIFFLLVLCLGVHAHFFFVSPLVLISGDDGIFSMLLKDYVQPLPGPVLFFVYFFLVMFQAMRLNFVLNKSRMFQQSGSTTAMAYVLLTASLPQWCNVTPALFGNTLVIWIFVKLTRLYNNSSPKTLLFNTGLIVGLTVLCYHPTAILVIVILFALAVVRPFRLAEWLVLLLGAVTPYYFLVSGLFLTDNMHTVRQFIPELYLNLPVHQADRWLWITLSVILVMLITGFIFWQPHNNRMVIQIRKNWGIMIVMLLIMLPIPFIFKNAGIASAILIIIPLASFISNVFLYPGKLLLPNLLFFITIIVIIHNNWMLVKN